MQVAEKLDWKGLTQFLLFTTQARSMADTVLQFECEMQSAITEALVHQFTVNTTIQGLQ
jgi:hypothetical protein